MDVGVLLPDFHVDRQVRVVDIHRHLGKRLRQLAAYGLGELDGVQGIVLVRPFALHLEAPGGGEGIRQVVLGGFHDGFHRLLTGHRPGDGHHTEDLPGGSVGRLHVAGVRGGLGVDGALTDVDLEAAAGFQAAGRVGHQPVLKGAAVLALEDHLAQLEQEHFILPHGIILRKFQFTGAIIAHFPR